MDECQLDTEKTSQRLRLLQDLCASAHIFPEKYWINGGLSMGPRIARGGEATLYRADRQGKVVAVRKLHAPIDPPVQLEQAGRSAYDVSILIFFRRKCIIHNTHRCP